MVFRVRDVLFFFLRFRDQTRRMRSFSSFTSNAAIILLGHPLRVALLILCEFFIVSASASEIDSVVDVSAISSKPLSLSNYFWVLEDQADTLTLTDVQMPSMANRFHQIRSSGTALSFGYTTSAFWLRLRVRNSTDQPIDRLLEIAYASLSHVHFFLPDANGNYKPVYTGSNYPFSSRLYPNRYFVFPVTLPAHTDQLIYLQVKSTSSVLIPGKLWSPQAYYLHARNDYFIQAWYFGIACAMVVFNLLLFFALRDRIYLLYGTSVTLIAFSFATDFGLSKEVLWPGDSTLWSDIANFIGYSSAAIASILFMRRMIDTKVLAPNVDKVVIAIAFLNALSLIGVVISLKAVALATVSLYIVTVIVMLGTAFYCAMFKRQRSAYFFLGASSALLIGCVVGGLTFLGMLSSNAFTENAMQLGSALEMLLLAFALADRVSELQREKKIAALAFESQEGIIITDEHQKVIRVNRAFSDITGYQAGEVIGKSPRILNSNRHNADFYNRVAESIRSSGIWHGEMWNRHADGEEYPVLLTITEVRDNKGKIKNYVGTLIDITLRKQAEAEINSLAFYDPLTQLPNRRMLMSRLKMALSSSERHHNFGALLFIDLDDFKTINDTLGHDFGDSLLLQVATRLNSVVRTSDTVARLGGDEFVVLLEDLSTNIEEAAAEAETVAEKILATIGKPYQLDDYTHICGGSIGVTIFSGQQVTVDELLKRTDLAMYDAKKLGGNNVRFFDPAMQKIVLARFALEASLREAVKKQQFTLHYQAQVLDDGRVIGAESLVRWIHPERGIIPPVDFIPIAERSKLIIPIGKWVLRKACEQLVAWSGEPAFSHLTIAVNVSSIQFKLPSFVEDVLTILESTGADPRLLKLELTESLLVDDVDDIIAKMAALKARGVCFSLDDFGTGYSSLAYIKQMPIDQLKIDKSFVKDVLDDPNDATIARTIIGLADSLGLAVIAEGVENIEQYQFLKQSGCRAFQGYFFARPLAINEFEQRVRSSSANSHIQ